MRRAALLVPAIVLALAAAARAATFHVTKTADTFDGACDADCSLREAVRAADDVYPEAHTILVPAGTYALTRAGAGENAAATGDLDIPANVTIVGAGRDLTIVDGGGLDRVFHAFTFTERYYQTVVLKHLTIRGGDVTAAPDSTGGGLRFDGDGLKVRVFDCVLEGNKGFRGGALLNNGGQLTMTDSVVRGNTANERSGGLDLQGGNLLRGMLIENNVVGGDCGGFAVLGAVVIEDSLVRGNQAGMVVGSGAGFCGGGLGTLVVRNVTVTGNQAARSGGWAGGGGLFENVTFADNTAAAVIASTPDARFRSALFSGNPCSVPPGGAYFPPASLGRNLETGNTCNFTDPTDQADVPDAKLGALADNGGPTETRALLAGSPAIGAGDPANCPPADQRGFPRADGACDVGAFEAGAPATPLCASTDLQDIVDDLSLRSVGCVVAGLARAAGL